jgi:hypothetical protein
VDGFRFDLASILTRANSAWHPTTFDENGHVIALHGGAAITDAATGEAHHHSSPYFINPSTHQCLQPTACFPTSRAFSSQVGLFGHQVLCEWMDGWMDGWMNE